MNTSNIDNEYQTVNLLFQELPYNYQVIIINCLKPLIKHFIMRQPTAPYDICGIISFFQKQKGLTDQELCDIVNSIYIDENPDKENYFTLNTLRSIKKRNSQKSPKWHTYIAKALDIDLNIFKKYLSNDEMSYIAQVNYEANTFELIYKSLDNHGRSTANILISSLYEQLLDK